jgi:magnesium-transporting ATPase (P-type)
MSACEKSEDASLRATDNSILSVKSLVRVAIIIGAIGIVLLLCSSAFSPYKEIEAVAKARLDYPAQGEDSYEASRRYWDVRDSQLTLKYPLEDYGLTLMATSISLFFILWILERQGLSSLKDIRAPGKVWIVILIGLFAALLEPIVFTASLLVDFSRGEFAPWADSIGIALMTVPFLLQLTLGVVILFSLLGSFHYRPARPLIGIFRRDTRPHVLWHILLGIPWTLSVLWLVSLLVFGDFLSVIPAVLWVMFLGSFYTGRQRETV